MGTKVETIYESPERDLYAIYEYQEDPVESMENPISARQPRDNNALQGLFLPIFTFVSGVWYLYDDFCILLCTTICNA